MEEDYPTLIFQQATDVKEDMSSLPLNTVNETLRQTYPILTDKPTTIIICSELPMNETLEKNKLSTGKIKRSPHTKTINNSKKDQVTSNYELRGTVKPNTKYPEIRARTRSRTIPNNERSRKGSSSSVQFSSSSEKLMISHKRK